MSEVLVAGYELGQYLSDCKLPTSRESLHVAVRPADVEKLDPVRRLIMERLVGIQQTLVDASRYIQRNEYYMHQFILRTTPKRLPEDVRGALADFLGV